MDKLVVVNRNDKVLGFKSKALCHKGEGILHRAFSCYIFNPQGELLIQKRSSKKLLWPGFWANSCCSHPRRDEPYETAGEQRLLDELGFSVPLKKVGKFVYYEKFGDIGSEREMCAVLIGGYDGQPKANPDEVAQWQWVGWDELQADLKTNFNKYAPWLKPGLAQINDQDRSFIQNTF